MWCQNWRPGGPAGETKLHNNKRLHQNRINLVKASCQSDKRGWKEMYFFQNRTWTFVAGYWEKVSFISLCLHSTLETLSHEVRKLAACNSERTIKNSQSPGSLLQDVLSNFQKEGIDTVTGDLCGNSSDDQLAMEQFAPCFLEQTQRHSRSITVCWQTFPSAATFTSSERASFQTYCH
jgi:hypothetical protein